MTQLVQPLRLRPFAAGDAPLLGAWLAGAGLGVPQTVPGRRWVERLIDDPNILCFTATLGGRIVGFFRLDTGPDQQAEITLIVAPGERRRGHGRALLAAALDQARARGLCRVLAVVDVENTAARSFFGDAGFEEVGHKTPGCIHLHRLVHRGSRRPPLEIQP
ncbi:MAG: GNAT family N-acetyltransferase [Planctomycetes bacterium]|nr:GNAT family N-acetyltransferase [Planctomycetota bacterium]MCB9870950.1 GNAT family N-acetyltransferase [Planctomycetota bacterium]MCB9888314.1 GNAT family N-acetyltransferase [Planctomycetota bacterium]